MDGAVSIKISLPSIMANVVAYLSLNEHGNVPASISGVAKVGPGRA